MVIKRFPDIKTADQHGLLAIGGDLELDSLLLAYRSGIFPWPPHSDLIAWFAPPIRTILYTDKVHLSRSLLRFLKNSPYQVRINYDFLSTISHCAKSKNRKLQSGTWITDDLINAYCALHQAGYAHSIETYFQNELVGGLYGVSIGGFFAGESMFYLKKNASKVALVYLIQHLQTKKIPWIDCQMMTPHMEKFGAVELERAEYMKLLETQLAAKVTVF